MRAINHYLFAIVVFFHSFFMFGQEKIGIVLSGGGATGLAHIGLLKALEEKGVPIDYITGTSAGALVGGMYAAGYSPEEIEEFAKSEAFLKMATGQIESHQRFTFREPDDNASMFKFGIAIDSTILTSIPTHYRSSAYVDYTLTKLYAPAGAIAGEDFNNLFIPYRCVASDIANKKSVVFSSGKLNQAVRASMTYPFYFEAIEIDKILLFDGGLYNNFPADVMYNDFNPDYIIGSNVSYNAPKPKKNNIVSQLTNMLVYYSNFTIPCDHGIMFEPKINATTFDFKDAAEIIDEGYRQALPYVDSILSQIDRRISKEEVQQRRDVFRNRILPIQIRSVSTNFRKNKPLSFAKNSMIRRKNEIVNSKTFERRYFRLRATPQIGFMFPTLTLNNDSTYNLDLTINKAKDFNFEVGGHFSTRAVNTGFIGVSYSHIGKVAANVYANTYFGKFYTSVKTELGMDIPSTYPVNISGYFILNKFDYFRSFATFFAPERPSFLVQNEMFTGLDFKQPIWNSIKSTLEGRYFLLEDRYYQDQNFTNADTTDFTQFQGATGSWELVQNTLNRKQFATSGHFAALKIRYVYGREHSRSGTTAPLFFDNYKYHSWINIAAEFQSFPVSMKFFHLGIHGNAVFNSQSLFSNYTASVLAMTAYTPLPDMATYFMPEFRSPQYVGAGLNLVFTIRKVVDIRADGYYYQPFRSIIRNDDGTFGYAKPFKGESFVASASIIYHSPIGPLRATFNYFPKQTQPYAFQLSFGYVLFNARAIR
ncbi:MAG: patatin-like phospholipase family protein [Crocinitomicaceae bacterium]|nr:patatin-like phospholipase family protein [Crocinitomicaceae bacterium]